ncbi:kinetochore protein NDC80 homolog [Argentina anserina]|uniref:kinetochore protein NDC80 homolog n=1 Tax=Argentina anserina TaxID=57926 RepID=UPI0021762A07|nr:kinetochore protein NDC80 homolog [Potentilla anserina]
MRGARRPKPSMNPRPPPPSTPLEHFRHRDSDASFASSRPSSLGIGGGGSISNNDLYKDRSYQQSALSAINSYLSSHSVQAFLKFPIPPGREITETLRFLVSRLDWPSPKLEDDLPVILKSLKCPFKLNKSMIRNPTVNSHQWPNLLAVIHWLFQLVRYNDHLDENSEAFLDSNPVGQYTLQSYLHYIRGQDDEAEEVDREFVGKFERQRDDAEEQVKALREHAAELEKKVEAMRSDASPVEAVERERSTLEEDVGKFHQMIENLDKNVKKLQKVLEEKEGALAAKREEKRRILEENEELKKRVESQSFNERDVERMRRELQAVERDIGEAELARNVWEEKVWDLENTLGPKVKELEALAMECNQVMRRLKLCNGFQYVLNPKGSTAAEVMGVDYKSTLRPALDSYSEKVKKDLMETLDELNLLQHQSSALSADIEGKRNDISTLQSRLDEVEAQLSSLRKETQDYTHRCEEEVRNMMDEVKKEAHEMNNVEREAAEILKTSKLKLQEVTRQSEEETQKCARKLITIIDSVSKYKEHVHTKTAGMKKDVSDTAAMLSDIHKSSLQSQYSFLFDSSQGNELTQATNDSQLQ